MAAFAVGDVVMVPFPYSDLTSSKLRPALVVAAMGQSDYLLCMVTSQGYNDPMAIAVPEKDIHSARLGRTSFVRPSRLFVGNGSIIKRKTGNFSPGFTHEIKQVISGWIAE